MAMKLFITGTDTGIGKTTVAVGCIRELIRQGRTVHVLKPVETGCGINASGAYNASDARDLWEASSRTQSEEAVTVYRFGLPAAPSVAAAAEGVNIDVSAVSRAVEEQSQGADVLVVEGAGGLLVPLTPAVSFADWAAELKLPAVVVVGSRLGALNHTLLTLEVLRHRGIPILGYVFNDLFQGDAEDQSLATNRQTLAELAEAYRVFELGYVPSLTRWSEQHGDEEVRRLVSRVYQAYSNGGADG